MPGRKKLVVGLIEEVTIDGNSPVRTLALFDTGARVTSVDVKLALKAALGPIIKTQKVRNPGFKQETMRPVMRAKINVKGRSFETNVNIQDRSHMTFPMIIGRNIISGNFLVDPQKNEQLFDKMKNAKIIDRMKGQAKLKEFIERSE